MTERTPKDGLSHAGDMEAAGAAYRRSVRLEQPPRPVGQTPWRKSRMVIERRGHSAAISATSVIAFLAMVPDRPPIRRLQKNKPAR